MRILQLWLYRGRQTGDVASGGPVPVFNGRTTRVIRNDIFTEVTDRKQNQKSSYDNTKKQRTKRRPFTQTV